MDVDDAWCLYAQQLMDSKSQTVPLAHDSRTKTLAGKGGKQEYETDLQPKNTQYQSSD